MSIYRKMRDANHSSLSVSELSKPVYRKSRLLRDVKEGKKPEKKHIPLDRFFK